MRLGQERMLDGTCVAIAEGEHSCPYPNAWLYVNDFAARLWAMRACGCGDRVTEALASRLIKRVGPDRDNADVSREGPIQR